MRKLGGRLGSLLALVLLALAGPAAAQSRRVSATRRRSLRSAFLVRFTGKMLFSRTDTTEPKITKASSES